MLSCSQCSPTLLEILYSQYFKQQQYYFHHISNNPLKSILKIYQKVHFKQQLLNQIMQGAQFIFNKINLFPYTNMWRYNKKYQFKTLLTGIISALIIAALLTLLIYRLYLVINKTNMTVTQQTKFYTSIPEYQISTFQNNKSLSSVMFAIDTRPHNYDDSGVPVNLNVSDFEFILSTSTQKNLSLQFCTQEHFKNSQLQLSANYEIEKWYCLPLNRTFKIGGNNFNKDLLGANILITCKSIACLKNNKTLKFATLFMNNQPNPQDKQNPIVYSLDESFVIFAPGYNYQFYGQFDSNIIITDSSLLFFKEDTSTVRSFELLNTYYVFIPYYQTSMSITIAKSNKQITYTRTFEGILEVISFVGGIYSGVLGFFFFLDTLNKRIFEANFAAGYFRNEKINYSFVTFLKSIWSKFASLWCSLQSFCKCEQSEEQKMTIKAVNAISKIQDIVYLNRRIQFLEAAIDVILEKNQIMALRLVEEVTEQKIEQNYRNHLKFRDLLQNIKTQRLKATNPQQTASINISDELSQEENEYKQIKSQLKQFLDKRSDNPLNRKIITKINDDEHLGLLVEFVNKGDSNNNMNQLPHPPSQKQMKQELKISYSQNQSHAQLKLKQSVKKQRIQRHKAKSETQRQKQNKPPKNIKEQFDYLRIQTELLEVKSKAQLKKQQKSFQNKSVKSNNYQFVSDYQTYK